MITADFCILPMGIESSEIGEYVAEAVEVIKASGIKYELTAMGTQMETESLEELYKVVQDTQEAIFKMGRGGPALLDAQTRDAGPVQGGAHVVQALVGGIDADLQPFHGRILPLSLFS